MLQAVVSQIPGSSRHFPVRLMLIPMPPCSHSHCTLHLAPLSHHMAQADLKAFGCSGLLLKCSKAWTQTACSAGPLLQSPYFHFGQEGWTQHHRCLLRSGMQWLIPDCNALVVGGANFRASLWQAPFGRSSKRLAGDQDGAPTQLCPCIPHQPAHFPLHRWVKSVGQRT